MHPFPAVAGVVSRALARRRSLVAVACALAACASAGCVQRSLVNGGLEPVPAPMAVTDITNMNVSPAGQAAGQRILRFDNQGEQSTRDARRKDADHLMAGTCAGNYVVGAEGPQAKNGMVSLRSDPTEPWGQTEYWYIQYICLRDTPSVADSAGRGR
jgi:hypothetical protein